MRLDPGQIEVMDDAMVEVYRRMTGAERLAIAWGMYTSARTMLLHHLRAAHPAWTEDQVRAEAAVRLSHDAS